MEILLLLVLGTRSSYRALSARGFEVNNIEVRLTRNFYLDRVLLKKRSRKLLARRASVDERRTESTTKNPISPKSILKKPKCTPFGVKGRRKSMPGLIELPRLSEGLKKAINQVPAQQFSVAIAGPSNSIDSDGIHDVSTDTFVPTSASTPMASTGTITNTKILDIQKRLQEICRSLNI